MSQQHLNIIKAVAIKAGKLALKHQADLSDLSIKEKQVGDFVSQADLECEELIKKELNKEFAGFSFLGEETGEEKTDSEYLWIVDPIDGTSNFLKGMKSFGCAICLQEKGETIVSVVYFPALDELYYASRDKAGAFLEFTHSHNKEVVKLDCSKPIELSQALISYGLGARTLDRTTSIMKKLCPISGGIRSLGASSLDIIKVANGEFGAYIKSTTTDWDLYPAAYIAEKAGAGVYDIQGREISTIENYNSKKDGCIIANKKIIKDVAETTKMSIDKSIETAKEIYSDKICPLANKAVETSTPYVKEACKKSKPYCKQTLLFCKDMCIKSKPYLIKFGIWIKDTCIKSKPYIIKGAIWLKEAAIRLFKNIKGVIKTPSETE